jgi:predicted ribosome quality control (RQC) complex YloA/Tae2 family protein
LEKHARFVPVDIVERRHVRKPRGSSAGKAIYTRARTVDVTPHSST